MHGDGLSAITFWSATQRAYLADRQPGTTEANFYTQSSPSDHAAGLLFSSITSTSAYASYQMPFPIILCDSRPPNMSLGSQPFNAAFVPLTSIEYELCATQSLARSDVAATLMNLAATTLVCAHSSTRRTSALVCVSQRSSPCADCFRERHARQLVCMRAGLSERGAHALVRRV